MSTLKADIVTASSTNGNLAISNQGTGGIAIDGMPHRNLIINGDMRIAQRGTSFAIPAYGYTLDRWRNNIVGAAVATLTQDTDTPTVAEAGTDFKFSMKIDVTTVDSSIAASDFAIIRQKIEGFNTAHLGFGAANAATVTLSFWVKSPKTGAHYVALRNGAGNRSYPALYTVDSADTWEKQEIVIVGDTSGSWIGATSGIGLDVVFTLLAGSNYHGTAGTWEGASDYSASDQVNIFDSTANNFFLTGCQLEAGAQSSDFEHIDYGGELLRCQRYYWEPGFGTNGHANGTSTTNFPTIWPVEMRTTPSISDIDTTPTINDGVGANITSGGTTSTLVNVDETGGVIRLTGFSGLTQYRQYYMNGTAAHVALSAEL